MPDGQGTNFVLFDVQIGHFWLSRANVENIADKLQIDVAPMCGSMTLYEAIDIVRGRKLTSPWPGIEIPEGLVLTPPVNLFDSWGSRIITKIKDCDFNK